MRQWVKIFILVLLQNCFMMAGDCHTRVYCVTCARTNDGHIKRNVSAKKIFIRKSGYPNGRPGYVVDHIVPLYSGGDDVPENMQWLTVDEHKLKHKKLAV